MWQVHSLTPYGCKQNARDFFSAPYGVSSIFFKKSVYERNFATLLGGLSHKDR